MADVVDTVVCYPDSPFRNKALIPSAARNVGIVYMPTYEIKMSPNELSLLSAKSFPSNCPLPRVVALPTVTPSL